MTLFSGLNDAQLAAVSAPPGPVLVLAGPGSGKTRVLDLSHRLSDPEIERCALAYYGGYFYQ